MSRAVAQYREYAPCDALREHVRAFFSFNPPAEMSPARRPIAREVLFAEGDRLSTRLFADGHASMVFNFSRAYRLDGLWHPSALAAHGDVIGAMSAVGLASLEEFPEMAGAYLRPEGAAPFTGVPAGVLSDSVVALEDLWGAAGAELPAQLCEMHTAALRIDRLEAALLGRIGKGRGPTAELDVPGLAAWVLRRRGRLTVQCLADQAGVSRQYLARVFRERIGVTPKLYCRLARFQAGLAYAGRGKNVDWAQAAFEMGYADQSHMIAEFREFSGLTPQTLATERYFHPFIERARRKYWPV